MNKSYGPCVGCNTALMWVKNLTNVDERIKERVLHRMMYEFDKSIPVKPKFHPGKYGHKYDSLTCGNCGHTIKIIDNFCSNCSFAIEKNDSSEERDTYEKICREEVSKYMS